MSTHLNTNQLSQSLWCEQHTVLGVGKELKIEPFRTWNITGFCQHMVIGFMLGTSCVFEHRGCLNKYGNKTEENKGLKKRFLHLTTCFKSSDYFLTLLSSRSCTVIYFSTTQMGKLHAHLAYTTTVLSDQHRKEVFRVNHEVYYESSEALREEQITF